MTFGCTINSVLDSSMDQCIIISQLRIRIQKDPYFERWKCIYKTDGKVKPFIECNNINGVL